MTYTVAQDKTTSKWLLVHKEPVSLYHSQRELELNTKPTKIFNNKWEKTWAHTGIKHYAINVEISCRTLNAYYSDSILLSYSFFRNPPPRRQLLINWFCLLGNLRKGAISMKKVANYGLRILVCLSINILLFVQD